MNCASVWCKQARELCFLENITRAEWIQAVHACPRVTQTLPMLLICVTGRSLVMHAVLPTFTA